MKHECNVIRDLMPLTLDGAASEESQQLLSDHLEECAACREYYGGMKAALPVALKANSEQEQKQFDRAARKVRKKRRRRLWLKIWIGFLVGILAMGGALWGWTRLTNDLAVPAYYGSYNVFLSQLQDGSVSFNMDFYGSSRYMGARIDEFREDGKQIMYVYNETTRITKFMRVPNVNYSFMLIDAGGLDELDEIRKGTPGEYAVVWKAGESISPASEEMEAYFALLSQVTDIRLWDDSGMMRTLTYEETQRQRELDEQLFAIKATVPEWQ